MSVWMVVMRDGSKWPASGNMAADAALRFGNSVVGIERPTTTELTQKLKLRPDLRMIVLQGFHNPFDKVLAPNIDRSKRRPGRDATVPQHHLK
jgi:hypothetical protein